MFFEIAEHTFRPTFTQFNSNGLEEVWVLNVWSFRWKNCNKWLKI